MDVNPNNNSARIDMVDRRVSSVRDEFDGRVNNLSAELTQGFSSNEAELIAIIQTLGFLWATLRQHVNDTTGVILPEYISDAMEEPVDEARS